MQMIGLQGIDHVALAVSDVPRSVAWYTEVIGLERLYEDAWGDVPAVVGFGGTAIALFPGQGGELPAASDPGIGFRHVAFRVTREGFEAARAEARSRGTDPAVQDHDIAHSIYLRDPDGYVVEITTYEI